MDLWSEGDESDDDVASLDGTAGDLAPTKTDPARCSNPEGIHLLAADSATLLCLLSELARSLRLGIFSPISTTGPFEAQDVTTSIIVGIGTGGLEADLKVEVR